MVYLVLASLVPAITLPTTREERASFAFQNRAILLPHCPPKVFPISLIRCVSGLLLFGIFRAVYDKAKFKSSCLEHSHHKREFIVRPEAAWKL